MLKAVPNIESRVKLLRTKTTAIADILRVSGFDWNYERSTIMCEKSAYDEYVKAHKEAAGLYGKSFPFFNYLVAVFTKDRAYGNARADIGDEARQVENEDDNIFEEDVGFSQVPIEEFSMPSQENDETPLPTPMESNSSSSKTSTQRKRKGIPTESTMDQISVNFRSFVEMVGPEFKILADAATRNAESASRHADAAVRNTEIATIREEARLEIEGKKKLLSQVLFNIEGLNDDEALIMLQALAKDEDQLKVFWDLPNDKKLRFCRIYLAKMPYIPPVV
ncbi:uncharacterized protein LOC120274072 [Dioscorea cayenensis subsp. rotundata]|uniref:Uncharacterized protein LOC120274072 n=1 Tax=Dioscorea cayennensis subsp. rotundata TaxID=55577 RepID=A0AB40CB05_DIOCR|nr:uncharacterized protein LOC120274072 [Dioscorea cayenensis subsp. rotundata]